MSYIGNQPYQVAFVTDTFSGNGSTTAFTMSVAPANTSSVLVAITGVLQDPSTYSVSGTTLTFSAAPPSGTSNISVRYLGIPASGVTTTAYRTLTEFTATAGQTTFTPPSYTVGYINVYRNGALLGTADYTATNGTTVVLASAATAGDLVAVESFYVSSVLNAIPATASSIQQTYLASGVAGTGPAFGAYLSTTQNSLSPSTYYKVPMNTEEFDTASCYDTSNYRFLPNIAGYYNITACVYFNDGGTPVNGGTLHLYKNGASFKKSSLHIVSTGTWYATPVSCLIYMNGSTDYLEVYGYIDGGAGTANFIGGSTATYWSGFLARAA